MPHILSHDRKADRGFRSLFWLGHKNLIRLIRLRGEFLRLWVKRTRFVDRWT
jgi:hypothetical protein